MSKKIPISDEWILTFAFRYALGRRSTAPGIVNNALKSKWNRMTVHGREQIQKEIGEAIANGYAGDFRDIETWTEILRLKID